MADSGDSIEQIEFEPIKIDKWCGSTAQYTLDDCVHEILTKVLNYEPSYKLMNIRLIISAAAVFSAAYALVYDFFHPFPDSTNILLTCVISYFVLTLILTLYSTFVEKGIFLVAYNDKNEKISLSSNLKRYDHMYNLTIEFTNKKHTKTTTLSKSISRWFDEDGNLVFKKLKEDVLGLHKKVISSDKKNN